jgi:hypothetical protein
MLGILFHHGADPNAKNSHGETPLHVAKNMVKKGVYEAEKLVALLMRHGAYADRKRGRT